MRYNFFSKGLIPVLEEQELTTEVRMVGEGFTIRLTSTSASPSIIIIIIIIKNFILILIRVSENCRSHYRPHSHPHHHRHQSILLLSSSLSTSSSLSSSSTQKQGWNKRWLPLYSFLNYGRRWTVRPRFYIYLFNFSTARALVVLGVSIHLSRLPSVQLFAQKPHNAI